MHCIQAENCLFLTEYEESPRPKTPDTDRSGKEIDKKMSDLGICMCIPLHSLTSAEVMQSLSVCEQRNSKNY